VFQELHEALQTMKLNPLVCVAGPADGDLPVQPHPGTDRSEREAGAALSSCLSYLILYIFFFLG